MHDWSVPCASMINSQTSRAAPRPPSLGGHPVRVLLGQCVRILHRDREPGSGHHRQIDDIVANVCNLIVVESGDLLELLIGRQFLAFALIDMLDTQAGHADAHHLGAPPGDDGDLDPGLLQHHHAVPVFGMERLVFLPVVADV